MTDQATQPTVYIIEFDLDQTHEEEFWEFEEGSPEEMAFVEKIGKTYVSGLAVRAEKLLGWTLTKSVGSQEPHRTFALVFSGEGRLEEHDQALLELSGTEEAYFSAVDLTHEITQGYDHGDHDTGSLSDPSESTHYAKYARGVGSRLGLV